MKKILFSVLLIVIVFGACNKYPDGPGFSLYTKNHRLANTWIIEQILEDGVDKTSQYQDAYVGYKLVITKEGNYELDYLLYNSIAVSEAGDWNWNSDKTHVIFTRTNSSTTTDWEILRLKEKELWAKYIDYSSNPAKEIIVHMKPL